MQALLKNRLRTASVWALLALAALPAVADEFGERSIKTLRDDHHYVRHSEMRGRIGMIRSERDVRPARFYIVPGLAGRCWSFEAFRPRGHYLRHAFFEIVLSKRIDQKQFNEDATFCVEPGLFGRDYAGRRTQSFRSFNFPTRVIRHRDFRLWLDPVQDSREFRRDASFQVMAPVEFHTFLGDTREIPAEE